MQHKKISCSLMLLIALSLLTGCQKDPAFTKKAVIEVTIGPTDSRLASNEIHLSKDTVYVLAANLFRDSGQILSIDAGTLIKVNDYIAITIRPGAVINAKGTATDPIIFTSSAYTGGVGVVLNSDQGSSFYHYWYGISIYGDASNNPGLGSGILSYVRIEFAGGTTNTLVMYPGLMLANVSKATTVENVQVSYAYANASFEFNGGNVNAKNLLSYASGNADFYIHGGYTGMLQHILAYRHPYFPHAKDLSAQTNFSSVLIDENETLPLISNLTVLGPSQQGIDLNYISTIHRVAALVTTGGSKFHIRNSVFSGFPKTGWWLDNFETASSIVSGESDLTYSIMHCYDSSRAFYLPNGIYPNATSADFKNYMLQAQFVNELFTDFDDLMLTDPFNYDVAPNPMPQSGSPLLGGADFDGIFSDPFFDKVEYRGALGTDNWMQGWTNFIPLQTNYNN